MSYPEEFTGFAIMSSAEWNKPKKINYPPKVFEEYDIDVKIEACGICGSDCHAAHGNWGQSYNPIVVGHEIIGKVVKIGSSVKDHKIGDRVGIGAQCYHCGECPECLNDNEQFCSKAKFTYFSAYDDGYNTQGGYANYIRLQSSMAFNIPERLESKHAAPLMCGGVTVFSPLVRNGAGPGKKVAISGIGGIGHMGILLAKCLGAEVTAISRSGSKKEAALKLGADHYIATNTNDWIQENRGKFDLVVNCGSSLSALDINGIMQTIRPGGVLSNISVPGITEKIDVSPFMLQGKSIQGSLLGSRSEIQLMLNLCAEKDIQPWVEEVSISEAGCSEVLTRADKGDVRFRFVLTQYDQEFGSS